MNLVAKAVAAYDFNFLKLSTRSTDPSTLATSVIDTVLLVAGILAVIYLIYAGILYITAGGNPDSAKKGQQGIINAVIGIVIIILAYVIANAVAQMVSGNVS